MCYNDVNYFHDLYLLVHSTSKEISVATLLMFTADAFIGSNSRQMH